MSDISGVGAPPPTPPSSGSSVPASYAPGGSSSTGGGGFKAFQDYFGTENYKKFVEGLCKAIAQQIGHDQKKAKEASDQLKRSTEGEDIDQP